MLEAQNIQKVYTQASNQLKVLKGINLKVKEGEVLTIVGPSGAGKSTLLHILGGLDKPDQGQVILESDNVYQLSENHRSRIRNEKIGFIFQFYHLLPEFTALENVMLPGLIRKNGQPEDLKQKADELLTKVGLADRLTHKPNQLSGGEQQRVAIARALINQPKIIFCDEPTGNLDSESGKVIIDLLLELNHSNNQTLIIVTHDEHVAKKSGRVIHLNDGMLLN